MSKTSLKRLIGTVTAAIALAPYAALAQFGGALTKLKDTATPAYGDSSQNDLIPRIGSYISIAIGLTGVVFLVLTVYAGYTWMTAQGDTKKVTEAKNMVTQAVIGLIIIALAYAITGFVFNQLGAASTTTSG
jgi:uncharacterized membrane protein YwzB